MEVYPYIAGSSPIESGLFNPGWQENRGITYSDLMWVDTGERLTEKPSISIASKAADSLRS